MEMAGLGKLSPNMMLIGFQEKWWACPDDADEYVRTIQSALDLHLSVGVFRIQSGFDLTSIGITNQNVMRQFEDKLIFVVCFWGGGRDCCFLVFGLLFCFCFVVCFPF